MDKYALAWIVWTLWFIVWETMALLDDQPGGTLSEHIGWLIVKGGSVVWFISAGLLFWFIYHFLYEVPGTLKARLTDFSDEMSDFFFDTGGEHEE